MNQMTGERLLLEMTSDELMSEHPALAGLARRLRERQLEIHMEITRREQELARQNANPDRSRDQSIEIKHGIEIK